MDASDRIMLVATPDLASLRDASRFIQISQSLSYPPEKLLVVLNREGQLGGVKTKDIESTLKRQVFAKIPEDVSKVQRSLNRGIPLQLKYPRSPTARAIKKLSAALSEMQVVEQIGLRLTRWAEATKLKRSWYLLNLDKSAWLAKSTYGKAA